MSTNTAESQARQMNDVVTEEVRVLLARRNLRSTALCPVLGMSQQGVSHRMTGRRQWSLNDLDALARYFGVDANTLLPGLGKQGVDGAVCAPWDLNPEPADLGSTFNYAPSPAYAERREVARQRHLHLLAPALNAPDRSDERLLGAAG